MEPPPGVIIGQKGVVYGLQTRQPPKKPAPQARVKPSNVFGADSDEEDVGAQVARQADKKRAAAKVSHGLLMTSYLCRYCMQTLIHSDAFAGTADIRESTCR